MALATACATAGRSTAGSSVSPSARAEVLDEVIIMRYGRISNWGLVDACSVYRAMDRDPDFRERLGTTARSKLSDETASSCGTEATTRRVRGRWYVRDITSSVPGEIGVTVDVLGESGDHREIYLLDQRSGHGMWRLREVRLINFSVD